MIRHPRNMYTWPLRHTASQTQNYKNYLQNTKLESKPLKQMLVATE